MNRVRPPKERVFCLRCGGKGHVSPIGAIADVAFLLGTLGAIAGSGLGIYGAVGGVVIGVCVGILLARWSLKRQRQNDPPSQTS